METTENHSGTWIRRVRESVGYSQTQFAALLGVKQSFLSAAERGVRKIPKKWFLVLNKEFSVSQTYFEIGVTTPIDKWSIVPKKSTNSGASVQKVHRIGTTQKNIQKSSDNPVEWENDHLFGQSGPKAVKPELTDEQRERQAMFNELYNSTDAGAFGQLDELRRNPGYFQTAHKLQTLRGKLGHDMSRTEPEAAWAVEKAQVFGMLTHNLLRFHLRYLDTFANASYNYHNAAGPLTETPIESLTYSEYREAMIKEAAKLQPYAEAVAEANTKMQEILRLLLPFDNAGLIDQFLID